MKNVIFVQMYKTLGDIMKNGKFGANLLYSLSSPERQGSFYHVNNANVYLYMYR